MPRTRHNENNLTDLEQSFCDRYLESGLAIQALRESKYSIKDDNQASTRAAEVLHRPRVQKYLQKKRAKQAERLEISSDRVRLEMARIATFDIRKLYDEEGNLKPVHELDDDTAAVVAGIEYQEIVDRQGSKKAKNKALKGYLKKIKLWSKDKQLENLARHFNMFEDDRAAGAIKISFNDIEEAKRVRLVKMMDDYFLDRGQKMLPAPVNKVDSGGENGSKQANGREMNTDSPLEVE